MFDRTQKLKKRIAPLDGHIVNDTISLIAKSVATDIPSGSFVVLMDKRRKIHVVDLLNNDWDMQLFEGAVYSTEARRALIQRLTDHLIIETANTHHMAKIFSGLKPHKKSELVGIGMAIPVDIAGVIRNDSTSHEVSLHMSDSTETHVYVSDGVPIAGTTDYVYGRLFPGESIGYLHVTKNGSDRRELRSLLDLMAT